MTAAPFDLVAFSAAQWILLFGFVIPIVILWGYAIFSLIGRPDLSLGVKALWLVGILIAPILGALVYFMLRPTPQEQQRRARASGSHR
jgi:Phospholipase_D-nuclease N-terminal